MLCRADGGRERSGGVDGGLRRGGGADVRLWPVGDPLRLRPCRRPLATRLPRQGARILLVHGDRLHDDHARGHRRPGAVGAWDLGLAPEFSGLPPQP